MSKAEKIGACLLLAWCLAWLAFIFLLPGYGTGVLR